MTARPSNWPALSESYALVASLVAARLSAEHGIGVRHGCLCAHPYLVRLLGLDPDDIAGYWDAVRHRDRRHMPGAIRPNAGLSTTDRDIDRLVAAVADIASGRPAPVTDHQDPTPAITTSRTG